MTRKEVLKELVVQEKIEGKSANIELMRKVIEALDTTMQLSVLTKNKHHRFGEKSYEVHRFWYPNDTLLKLLAIQHEKE